MLNANMLPNVPDVHEWLSKAKDMLPSAPSASDLRRVRDLPKLVTNVNKMRKINFPNDEDIVVFVGPTKSGKSTLINCLLGTPLACMTKQSTGDTFIINRSKKGTDDSDGPKISSNSESETAIPEMFQCKAGLECTLWDLPGFDDNRGTYQEIINAIIYQKLFIPQKSVRFVLVIDYAFLRDVNTLPLLKILNKLEKICPQTENNVCLVVTKFEKNISVRLRLEEIAESELSDKTDTVNTDIAIRGKKLIQQLLRNNAIIDFKQPKINDDPNSTNSELQYFEMPEKLKREVIDCLKKLNGIKIKNGMPFIISAAAKVELTETYSALYHLVKGKIDDTCSFINNYFSTLPHNLKYYNETQSKVVEILKTDDLANLLTEVNKFSNDFKTRVSDVLPLFTFIEDINNGVSGKGKWVGATEFHTKLRGALLILSLKVNEGIIRITTDEKAKEEEKERMKFQAKEIERIAADVEILKKSNEAQVVPASNWFVTMLNTLLGWLGYN